MDKRQLDRVPDPQLLHCADLMHLGGRGIVNKQPWLHNQENRSLLLKAQLKFLFECSLPLPACCTTIVCEYTWEETSFTWDCSTSKVPGFFGVSTTPNNIQMTTHPCSGHAFGWPEK
jgi:hypothetical protein